MEAFRDLVLSRCSDFFAEELKSAKTQKEFLDIFFKDLGEHLKNNIVSPDELISQFSPIELFHYGFLTQDNNPIDFTQLVNIDGVKWYNINEDLGVVNEDNDLLFEYKDKKIKDEDGEVYETSIRELKIKFEGKKLPKIEDFEAILSYEENLGYYNGVLSKVFDKRLVFPIHNDIGYISQMRKTDDSYQCLYVALDEEAFIDDSGEEMLIRCIKSRSKPVNKNGIEPLNQDNSSTQPVLQAPELTGKDSRPQVTQTKMKPVPKWIKWLLIIVFSLNVFILLIVKQWIAAIIFACLLVLFLKIPTKK